MEQYKKVGNLKVRTDLSPEQQAVVDEIAKRYIARDKEINADNLKNMGRIAVGSILSGASMHPIFNIPYVGTGLGGAMYDAGQAIVEGDKLGDIAKRAGRGFAIGETVGTIPYVGKLAGKTKAGQSVGKQFAKVAQKVAANPAIQKAYDALMTDVKAFNPNKQTVFHGSPYDFEKFSNEAIGTGEGAQAHGMGHYTALNKDIADKRYRQKLLDTTQSNYIIDDVLLDGNYPLVNHNFNPESVIKDAEYYGGTNKLLEKYKKDYAEAIEEQARIKSKYSENADPYRDFDDIDQMLYSNANILEENLKSKIPFLDSIKDKKITQNEGQLYKLSIPKDDVMLREGATFAQQPQVVQKGLKSIEKDFLNKKGVNSLEDINNKLNELSRQYENIIKNESPWDFGSSSEKSLIQAKISDLENVKRLYETPDIYEYLKNHAGLNSKELSDVLYNKGIKGISYNGDIDGEARVIFNPDDIDIVRKYYNQPTLKDIYNKFINSGTLAGALTNP